MHKLFLTVALVVSPTVCFAQTAGGGTPPPAVPVRLDIEAHNLLVNQYQVSNYDPGDALLAEARGGYTVDDWFQGGYGLWVMRQKHKLIGVHAAPSTSTFVVDEEILDSGSSYLGPGDYTSIETSVSATAVSTYPKYKSDVRFFCHEYDPVTDTIDATGHELTPRSFLTFEQN